MMLGLGVAALIIGYALLYTGVSNLMNGGQGPGFFESLGVTKTLANPGVDRMKQGSGNQIGQIPSPSQSAPPIQGDVWV